MNEDLRAVIARIKRLFGYREETGGPFGSRTPLRGVTPPGVRPLNEVLPLTSNVILELYGPDGQLKDRREGRNLICTAGKEQVLLYTAAKTLSQFAYMAVGTNSTAANAADTTLGTEIARSTVITPTNPNADTLSFAFTFAAGTATGALTEIGMLDAASVGHLLNHLVFSVVNKGSLDSLVATVTFTL